MKKTLLFLASIPLIFILSCNSGGPSATQSEVGNNDGNKSVPKKNDLKVSKGHSKIGKERVRRSLEDDDLKSKDENPKKQISKDRIYVISNVPDAVRSNSGRIIQLNPDDDDQHNEIGKGHRKGKDGTLVYQKDQIRRKELKVKKNEVASPIINSKQVTTQTQPQGQKPYDDKKNSLFNSKEKETVTTAIKSEQPTIQTQPQVPKPMDKNSLINPIVGENNEKLKRLESLKAIGLMSEDEFEREKARLLGGK
jgi:hypothetical protein